MSQRFAEKSNFTVADLSFATTSRTHVIKGLFVGADPEIGGGSCLVVGIKVQDGFNG